MKKSIYDIEPFASGYINAKFDNIEYKIANAMLEYAKHKKISINKDRIFAGMFDPFDQVGMRVVSGYGIVTKEENFIKNIEENPEFKEQLTDIMNEVLPQGARQRFDSFVPSHYWKLITTDVGYGGGMRNWTSGHTNPDYMLKSGTNGVRGKIEEYRKINKDKDVFYDALLLALDAIDALAERYRCLALEMAETETGKVKSNLIRIAEALSNVPKNAPRNVFEAFQSFWLVFTMDGIDSPGRFDQCMAEYYINADVDERMECLEGLWELFHDTRTWNLCISGSDEFGNDMTNELSYDILKVARKFKYDTPNLTMRVHKNTPDNLWKSAAETLATGIGMPAIYNDECVCEALQQLGISEKDSHNYCMNGCNQIDIFGQSHMGLEDGEVCLAKCLEFTLNHGTCRVTGDTIGADLGNPEDFKTFEEFFSAYKKQVEYITDMVTEMANLTQKVMAEFSPNPHRSLMVEGCIEKGLDIKNKGPKYASAQILLEGIADAVDSIATVKYFIYDIKKYKMSELLDALDKNFEGYDELYLDFSKFKKFGNNDEYVDSIYVDVLDHFNRYLLTKTPYRGGKFGGGCSTFERAARYGGAIGALPNGKKKGETLLADSIGATPGRDTNGITSLLNSVLKADHTLAKSGFVLQLKFVKSMFNTPEGMENFITLAKTYFAQKGQQLTVNVLSREELIEAKKHPEQYKNLVVRVGGYSDYFVRLDEGLQDNIIARTEIRL